MIFYYQTLHCATPIEDGSADRIVEHNNLAWTQRHRRPEHSLKLAREAEKFGRRHNDKAILRRSLVTVGACYNQLHQGCMETTGYLREAITLCEAAGDELLLGEALVELGEALICTHEYTSALSTLERSITIHQELGLSEWEVRTGRLIGRAHIGLGNFGDAMQKLMTALEHAEKLGFSRLDRFFHTDSHLEHSLLLNAIAAVYANMNEFTKAIQLYRTVVRNSRKAHPQVAAKALYNMGIAFESLSNYPSALDTYHEALKLHEKIGDHTQVSITQIGIGRVYVAMEIFGAARSALLCATNGLVNDQSNTTFYADAIHALGEIYLRTHEYQAAIDCFKQVETLHQATRRSVGAFAWLHRNLYLAYKAVGDHEHALHHHELYHRMNREHLEQTSTQQILELMIRFETERAVKDRETLYLRSAELEQQIAKRHAIEAALASAKAELEKRNLELEKLSKLDPLTEVYNRRYLNQTLAQQIADTKKQKGALSVMLCDVDNFKEINDRCSHVTGDEVLRTVARIFQDTLRPVDTIARYGGEEFVVIFPGLSIESAGVLTERLLDAVRDYPWHTLHPTLAVTLSAGLAQLTDHSDYENLIHQADQELYRAKNSGKDCYSPRFAEKVLTAIR